jgi:hypothetical protein
VLGATEQSLLLCRVRTVDRDKIGALPNDTRSTEAPDALSLTFQFVGGCFRILVQHK